MALSVQYIVIPSILTIPKIFLSSSIKTHFLNNNSPPPLSPCSSPFCSVSINNLPVLRAPYKWNHTVSGLFHFSWYFPCSSMLLHEVSNSHSFYGCVAFHCPSILHLYCMVWVDKTGSNLMDKIGLFIHLSVDTSWLLWINAAMIMGVQYLLPVLLEVVGHMVT